MNTSGPPIRLECVLVSLIAVFAVLSQSPGDIEKDGRLAGQISAHEAIVSLESLTADLGKKTGVPLTVKKALADRKVTVVFQNRPAVEAMRMIGTAMLMQWRPTKDGGYQLDLQDRAASEERQTEIFERDLLHRSMLDSFKEIKRLTQFASEEERLGEADSLQSEFKRRLQAGEEASSPAMSRLARTMSAIRSLGMLALAKPLAGDAATNEAALLAGRTIFSSTVKEDGVTHLDIDPYKKLMSNFDPKEGIGMITFDPGWNVLRFEFRFQSGENTGVGGLGGSWQVILDEDEPSPLDKRMAAWSAEVSDPAVLKTALGSPIPPVDPGYLIKAYSNAEHLVYLADQAKVPVVADAFRNPVSEQNWFPGETVQEWLGNFNRDRKAYPFFVKSGHVRTEKGWLMFRHRRWWRELPGEISERILLPLEARYKAGQPIGLEEHANFVAQLSDRQALRLREPSSFLARFRKGGIFAAVPALRLYGALSGSERAAVRGDGFNLARLSPARQIAIEPFYYQYLATSVGPLAPLRQIFPGRTIPDPQIFFVEDQNLPPSVSTQDLDSLPRATRPYDTIKGRRHYRFSLGTSRQEGFDTTMTCD